MTRTKKLPYKKEYYYEILRQLVKKSGRNDIEELLFFIDREDASHTKEMENQTARRQVRIQKESQIKKYIYLVCEDAKGNWITADAFEDCIKGSFVTRKKLHY